MFVEGVSRTRTDGFCFMHHKAISRGKTQPISIKWLVFCRRRGDERIPILLLGFQQERNRAAESINYRTAPSAFRYQLNGTLANGRNYYTNLFINEPDTLRSRFIKLAISVILKSIF